MIYTLLYQYTSSAWSKNLQSDILKNLRFLHIVKHLADIP